MKIGYVLNFFPSITQTFILNEIIELKKEGHEILIFSIHHPTNNVMHSEIKRFNLLDRVHYLPNQKTVDRIKLRLRTLGFFGWKYPSENIKEKVLAIGAAKYFSEIIKNKRLTLDVLHAHFNGIAVQVAMLMSKKLNIPFTFTTHAVDIFKNLNINVLKKRISNSLQTITVSNFNKEYLENLTGIKEIKVIHDCPDTNKISKIKVNKSKKGSKKEFNLISVARLIEKKGIKYAILALKEIIQKYNINYTIIGKGKLRNKLIKLIEKFKLEKNIKLIEVLTNRGVLNKIKKSDIFVLPCIRAKDGDMDGIPVALMEAMALEKPIISTKISAILELIENEKQGLLVEPKNVKQLVNAVKKLLENKQLRIKLGKNGRKKIGEQFNIHKEVEKLLKIWGSINEKMVA